MNFIRTMTGAVTAACGLACAPAIVAQVPVATHVEAPRQPGAVPLLPEGGGETRAETWVTYPESGHAVRNVTRPTLMPFLPKPGKATGAAVIVAPGGAFMILAIEKEGWRVAQALAERGIAAFVLKYRLNETPDDETAFGDFAAKRAAALMNPAPAASRPAVDEPRAVEDALAAVRLVRANAAGWGVDPLRVGMMGFSAGAVTALNAAVSDDIDGRPDFIAPIYPSMAARSVPAYAPPMFVAMALDDELFGRQGFGLVESWHRANRPVEFHAYERGGHGFALGKPGTTSTLVLDEFVAWLNARAPSASRAAHGAVP